MKNKKINLILIPLVLLIWGGVGYRILIGGEKKLSTPITTPDLVFQVDTMPRQELSLKLNYRDPFFSSKPQKEPAFFEPSQTDHQERTKDRFSRPVPSHSSNSLIVEQFAEKREAIQLPEFRYAGGVRSSDDPVYTGIIYVKNIGHRVRPGDSLEGVLVMDIDAHGVTFQFSDSIWTVSR